MPVRELAQKLEESKVVESLKFISEALGISIDIPAARRSEGAWLFREAVGLMESGELDPYVLLKIIKGDACIESFGCMFKIVER